MAKAKTSYLYNDTIPTPAGAGTPEYYERMVESLTNLSHEVSAIINIRKTPEGDVTYGTNSLENFHAVQLFLYGDMPKPRHYEFRLQGDTKADHAEKVRIAVDALQGNDLLRDREYAIKTSANGTESVFCFDRRSHMFNLWTLACAYRLVEPQRAGQIHQGCAIPAKNLN